MDTIRKNLSSLSGDILLHSETMSKKKNIFPSNISLMIVSKLVPSKKFIRCHLPYRPENLSVCLIVKDVDKLDYNKTVDAWKLRWKADSSAVPISCAVPTFLPLRELKIAYQTFAAKQRLSATFDLFLADRRIMHHLPTKLGKAFYGRARGKTPVPVDIAKRNVVQVVENELATTLFQIRGLGTSESIPIANTHTPLNQLKDNILHVCEKVCSDWPDGGLDNIRSMYIQCPKGNIPIYFDPSEAPVLQIDSRMNHLNKQDQRVPPLTQSAQNGAPEKPLLTSRKMLTADLLAQVSEDLPIPSGGLTSRKRNALGRSKPSDTHKRTKLRKK
ncbi:unnamed protein product [Dicrocoelium dendriticum]|nr:unnamed protein product [Dicrocoelium dendriticum]